MKNNQQSKCLTKIQQSLDNFINSNSPKQQLIAFQQLVGIKWDNSIPSNIKHKNLLNKDFIKILYDSQCIEINDKSLYECIISQFDIIINKHSIIIWHILKLLNDINCNNINISPYNKQQRISLLARDDNCIMISIIIINLYNICHKLLSIVNGIKNSLEKNEIESKNENELKMENENIYSLSQSNINILKYELNNWYAFDTICGWINTNYNILKQTKTDKIYEIIELNWEHPSRAIIFIIETMFFRYIQLMDEYNKISENNFNCDTMNLPFKVLIKRIGVIILLQASSIIGGSAITLICESKYNNINSKQSLIQIWRQLWMDCVCKGFILISYN